MVILDSIKKGFAIACKSILVVLLILALNMGLSLLVSPLSAKITPVAAAFQANNQLSWEEISSVAPFLAIIFVLAFLISSFVLGGQTGYVAVYLKEGRATLRDFISSALKYYVRFLILPLILLLIFAVALIVGALLVAVVSLVKVPALLVVLGIVLIVALFLGLLFISMSPYALVHEDTGVITSLRKSASFVQHNFLMTLGINVLIVLVSAALNYVFGQAALAVGTGPALIAAQIIGGFVAAFFGLFSVASLMAFYISLRNNT